ncbi:MAG TPA: DnaJ domain-containing protein [Bryobacteraceae bacterium]|nr:DnaJ domain-containing protein [Bryobacteraceae bacterium]
MRQNEARRHWRKPVDCELSLSWQDKVGNTRFIRARGLDVSEKGARIETEERIDPNSYVFINMDQYGLAGSASVRHCTRRDGKFVIGLEMNDVKRGDDIPDSEDLADYYEFLQISPNAETETIQRVYRMLVVRLHPDNPETGDCEKFLQLNRAYRTLIDPQRRAEYDSRLNRRRSEPLKVFELKEFIGGVEGEANRRLGVLCLLYMRRRSNPEDPGLSLLEFEQMMSFPREHLMFTFWFLKEKGFIRPENNGDCVITALGADFVESSIPAHRSLYNLLHAPEGEPAPYARDLEVEHSAA